jgi:isopropylmalate/homocitrate/citramalate synthase
MSEIEPLEGNQLKPPWFTPQKWVSPLNFLPEVRSQMSLPERVLIHDVTLRDGEQSSGVVFREDEKVAIAKALSKAGIPSIEVGLAAVSEEDVRALRRISELGLQARIMVLARLRKEDVEAAVKNGAQGIVLEIGINPWMVKYAFKLTTDSMIQGLVDLSHYAKDHGLYVEFMGWEAFRLTNLDYVKRVFTEVVERGRVDRITIADTFGMAHPLAVQYMVRKLKQWLPHVPLSYHVHNDFGLATAAAIMALTSGADGVHTSFNGLGERTGNVATEEVVAACELLLGIPTGVDTRQLYRIAQMISQISKRPIADNKPIVGPRILEIESGIPIFLLNILDTLGLGRHFGYDPALVGHPGITMVAGKGSGRAYVQIALQQLGKQATEEQIDRIVAQVKEEGMVRKGVLPPGEFERIVDEVLGS